MSDRPRLSAHDMAVIAGSALLGGLPEKERHRVAERAAVLDLDRGATLFLQDDPAERLFLVLEGWVKVFRLTPDGNEAVVHLFTTGESFAEPAVFTFGRYPASAQAAAESRVLAIPGAVLIDLVRREPDMALRIIGVFSQRLHALVSETERRQVLSTPRRLAAFLLDLAREGGKAPLPEGPVTVHLPYDKALAAARLGMTPESFSRALARLRAVGIESRGSTVVVDAPARLAAYVEGDAPEP